MPNPRRSARPAPVHGGWRPLAGAGLRLLSPRGALALADAEGSLLFAARAALAVGVIAVPLVCTGHPGLAVHAMLGSFTTTFGRDLPYARRARVLAATAVAMTACVGCGAALAAWAGPGDAGAVAVVVAATALVAGAAKFACDATRLSGLGAVMLLFSFAVAANGPATGADVLPFTALAAAGAASAWLLAAADWRLHPDRPQRLAVATALRRVAALLETDEAGSVPRPTRHRATVAVLHAYQCLGYPPPASAARTGPARDAVFMRLTDLCWTLLVDSAQATPGARLLTAGRLRRQARLLGAGRRTVLVLPELRSRLGATAPFQESGRGGDLGPAQPPAVPADSAALRATELLIGPPGNSRHYGPLVVSALRMTLGTGVAGGLAVLLDLEHGYWAAISAAAVLHSVNLRTTAQRAAQRALGTAVGLLLALAVLGARPEPLVLVLAIVGLEFLLECVVARNYALGVVFLTPLALLLSDLSAPAPAGDLVLDRVLGSGLGIAVGLVCALLVVHDRAAVRVDRALAACTEAADLAERSPAGDGGPRPSPVQMRLVAAAVELREADDAAAGELLPAGIDPARLAAAERRAYALLRRLERRGPGR
ncbi:FUSC family protein [Streptomyces sp. NPDC059446]|uniref:FUSC family protein n=1 Tax=Streptomyces sp. NPDC059446 TaxID=3346833 RepID=UPI00368A430E